MATKYYIELIYFKDNGRVSDDHPNAAYLNVELQQTVLDYERKLLTIKYENYDVNRVVELLTAKTAINDFSAYFERFIKEKKADHHDRTAELYQCTLDKIRKYEKRSPLMVEDITSGWLTRFEAWKAFNSNLQEFNVLNCSLLQN